ncbi:MAG TPA: pilus assembly protein N-terminal domain-containing protein [Pirellulales bacterium]|nr:pilus assembly protein N-terminal domain-containing protein [Pirellulales bacterium]
MQSALFPAIRFRTAALVVGSCLIQLGFSNSARAQPPDGIELIQPPLPPLPPATPEPLIGGFEPQLPAVPRKAPAANQRWRAASSFIDSLTENDAMFEVVRGQGRLLVLKEDLVQADPTKETGQAMIAVGDPEIVDYEVLDPRHIRLLGKKIGVTDLVVTTINQQTYSYEVHVVYDLRLLGARIRELFPDAEVRIAQLGENLVVEGQARDSAQIARILQVIQKGLPRSSSSGQGDAAPSPLSSPPSGLAQAATANAQGPEVVNLLRVPGPQQVLLKVQIAELNRTALRQIGSDMLFSDGSGRMFGSKLNSVTTAVSNATGAGLLGNAATNVVAASPTTAFGVLQNSGYQALFSLLRQNSLLKILAEPNLVAMNGHEARFLAGGEFPVPVPQSGAGGGPATITVQWKKFGVQLTFVPYILDGDTIRLSVDPEVSTIDFALGIELSGTRVPGLNTRNAHTVVELREGQTLAMAGLLSVTLSNQATRIPGLGDLPYIGPFFSNTTGNMQEKELLVLVTPYLVEGTPLQHAPLRPGDDVYEPNDLEFYLFGRLQGHTGHREFRSTTVADDPCRRMKLECRNIQGPIGFSE